MTPQEIINDCVYTQCLNTIKVSFKDKQSMSFDELVTEFNNVWYNSSEIIPSKEISKKTKVKKEIVIDQDKICIAIKKNGEQCKGKKNTTLENPELCILHNKNGVLYGTTSDTQDNVIRCEYIFTRGVKKNTTCKNLVDGTKKTCKTHSKNTTNSIVKSSENTMFNKIKSAENKRKNNNSKMIKEFDEDEIKDEIKDDEDEIKDDEDDLFGDEIKDDEDDLFGDEISDDEDFI